MYISAVTAGQQRAYFPKTTTESTLVWGCMQALEKLRLSNKKNLVWTPEHHGMHVNKDAHKLAKKGLIKSLLVKPWAFPL